MIKCSSLLFLVTHFSYKKKRVSYVSLNLELRLYRGFCQAEKLESSPPLASISPRVVVQPRCKMGKQSRQQQLDLLHSV